MAGNHRLSHAYVMVADEEDEDLAAPASPAVPIDREGTKKPGPADDDYPFTCHVWVLRVDPQLPKGLGPFAS
jgi:hypothetical protein